MSSVQEYAQEAPGIKVPGRQQTSVRRNGRHALRDQAKISKKRVQKLTSGLALASLGLGLAALAAPRRLARLVGVPGDHRRVVLAFGAREIGHALAILAAPRQAPGVWSRVAGDAVDLAALSMAYKAPRADRGRLLGALSAVAGLTVVDVLCAFQLSQPGVGGDGKVQVKKSIAVNLPPEPLYQFWHNFERLPAFMGHLKEVRSTGPGQTRWVAKAPAGATVEWDAQIVEDRPNELIAWRSLPGSEVTNAGSVRFERAPGDRGTIITVEMEYRPPAGKLGALAAKFFGEEPTQQLQGDLRRFKQVMETGEVVRSDATLRGESFFVQRPARPPARRVVFGNGGRTKAQTEKQAAEVERKAHR